ncbi:MAG: FtsX-like permease family protein [Anaerolineae bacterium]|nr:FtsX-like permease family protein [Anaerolineae bacterium]
MIKTRLRKILRDVWARKGRTLLVSTAILIGVTGTIALFSMSDVLISQLREDIKEDELTMAQVSVTVKEGLQTDDVAYMQTLSKIGGVTAVQTGFEEVPLYFKVDPADEKFKEGYGQAYLVLSEDGTQLVDAPFDAPAPIEPFRLLEGGAWPTVGQNELLVERRMADEYDLKVGDTLYMRALSPSRDPEHFGETSTTEAWAISGIVFDAYGLYPDVSIFTRFSDGAYLRGVDEVNDFWFRFTDFVLADDVTKEIEDYLATDTAYKRAFTEKQNPEENQLIANAELFANLMSFLALISLVVSGFLVINVITSLVTEQKQQIGVMKAIGATKIDNFLIYSGIAFAYGIIGVIPGVILGIPLGNVAAHGLAPQLNTVIEGFQFSPGSIILGVVVGLAVPVIASLLPVFNGTRVQILDAMTDLGIDANYGTGPIARFIGKLPIPITVRQGLSNVSIKKSRLAFTVITLAVAVGAFMGIFALFESLTDGIDVFLDSWNIHAGIFPTESIPSEQAVGLLENNFADRINPVQPGFMQQVEFEGYEPEMGTGGPPGIFAYGYDITSDDPAFLFELTEGETLTEENAADGLILASLLAANMDKTVGDTVVMNVPGKSQEFTVVGIADFPIDQLWGDWRTLALLGDSTINTIDSAAPDILAMMPDDARGLMQYMTKYLTVAQVDGVDAAEGIMIMGFKPAAADIIQIDAGEFVTAGEPGIMISSAMAASGGYALGDTLTLSSTTPSGEKNAEYPIVGIFSLPIGGDAAAQADAAGDAPDGGMAFFTNMIGMYWMDAATFDGATVETEPLPMGYFITVPENDPAADEITDLVDEMNETFRDQGINTVSFNFIELTDEISQAFFTIQAILSAVAGLIALVGALGLLTTLSMSVFERQKEIGVMRSIGAGSMTVAIQFLTEGIVVGLVSWLVGIPLMILIQYALLDITGFNETFPFQFSVTATVAGLIGMLVVTTIASLWPSLGAARKTVSDILRYQ